MPSNFRQRSPANLPAIRRAITEALEQDEATGESRSDETIARQVGQCSPGAVEAVRRERAGDRSGGRLFVNPWGTVCAKDARRVESPLKARAKLQKQARERDARAAIRALLADPECGRWDDHRIATLLRVPAATVAAVRSDLENLPV